MIIDIEFGIFKIFRKCLKTIKKIALLTTINGYKFLIFFCLTFANFE